MDDNRLANGLSRSFFVVVMCFVGGFVESAGYIKLFGLFTSSITGNLTIAAIAVFRRNGDVLARVLVTVFYALGVFIVTSSAHAIERTFHMSTWDAGLVALGQELVTMFITTALAIALTSVSEIDTIKSWQCVLTGSAMALAMGIQSAAVPLLITDSPSTTVMTANITKASVAAADTLHTALYMGDSATERDKYRAARATFVEMSLVIVAFVVGVGAGAVITIRVGFYSLMVPDGVLAAITIWVYIRRAKFQHNEDTEPPPGDATAHSAVGS